MSAAATAAAWAAPDLQPTHRLVLLALAEGADPDGAGITVHLAKLAGLTGLSSRTVHAAVDSLTTAGRLRLVEGESRGLPAVYGIPLA